MRIRTKFIILQSVLTLGLVIMVGLFVLLTINLTKQKNFHHQAVTVLEKINQLTENTVIFFTSRENLSGLRNNYIASQDAVHEALQHLVDLGADSNLLDEQIGELESIQSFWRLAYQPEHRVNIQYAYQILGDNFTETTDEELGFLTHYEARITEDIRYFTANFLVAMKDIQTQNIKNIQKNQIYIFLAAVLVFGIAGLVITLFSSSMGKKIRWVEEAMGEVAQGSFSYNLNIKSGDEFEELSHNYNSMKDQLKSKMDTVLNFTASISPDFEKGPNLGQTLFGIAKSAMKDTEADGAVLYLVSRESNTLKPEIIVGNYVPPFSLPPEAGNSLEDILEYIQTADIRIGDGVIGKVAESVSPIFLRTGAQFKEYDFYRSPDDPLCISSLIVAPLTIKNRLIGVIATIRCPPGEVFSDIDFITFRTFADYSALIIEHYYGTIELIEKREMSREISIAAEIQNKLLPEKIPKLSSAQIAIFSKAARGISGDYYDIIPINNGEIGLLICDVVGKGVPASLFMVTIHSIISLVGQKLNLPGSILTYLNRGLMKRIGSEQFATMSIFTYDEGTHTVTYSNAAHPPLLLYRPERQTFQEIDTRGLPVGVEQTEKYENTRFTVQKGDIVVLFTDGISEARASDGREYTLGKLKNRIQQSSSKSAKEIISSIKGDIEAFTAGTSQHDDQTIIVFRVIK